MKRLLITGATGNVGTAVVHFLYELEKECQIIIAARVAEEAKKIHWFFTVGL